MQFIELILKSPFRNKTRSALSVVGIAIGITMIVALSLITAGLEASMSDNLNEGGAEITAYSADSDGTNSFGVIDPSYEEKLKSMPGVQDTSSILSVYVRSSDTDEISDVTVEGVNPSKLNVSGVNNVVEGEMIASGSHDALIGKTFANGSNISVGDTFHIRGEEFTVKGIFETGSVMTDSNIYVPIDTLQNITDNDDISQVLVKTVPNANDTQISESIENTYPDLSTTTSAELAEAIHDSYALIDQATLAISLLAIIVGGIGILNTMIMSVYERTKEIGVLKAVGWTNKRVYMMIIGESIVLTTISAIIGSIVGIIFAEIGSDLLMTGENTLTLVYEPQAFILAFALALFVGIIGGLYPAHKASKLAPTEALRYE